MRPLLIIFATIALLGCKSPLFDHTTKKPPQTPTSSPSSSTEAMEVVDPWTCSQRLEKSGLCVSIIFDESPSYQASLKSFSARLRIWSENDKALEISKKPTVFHQHPKQCCMPPPIRVSSPSSDNVFNLSQIEFHAEGVFDFFIEINLPDGSTDGVLIHVNVAAA